MEPWEITRNSVSRSTPCLRRKNAAWLSSSWSRNTSRLPVSTCLALDTARVHDRLLDDPIQPHCGLGFRRSRRRHWRKGLREHLFELLPQNIEIDAAGREHVPRLRLVGRRPEKVLEPDCIVTALSRQTECALNGFECLGSEGNRRLGIEGICDGDW